MKALSVIGLLFVAAIIATVPISPQVTPRGIELSVDQAQAQVIYRRARRVARRAVYGAAVYGSGYGYGYPGPVYGPGYGYGYPVVAAGTDDGYGYSQVEVSPGRWCTIYPSGFHWCWTYF
jgi:hypothetical protein